MYSVNINTDHIAIMSYLHYTIEAYHREKDRRHIIKVEHLSQEIHNLRYACNIVKVERGFSTVLSDRFWLYTVGVFELYDFPNLNPIRIYGWGVTLPILHINLCPNYKAVVNRLLKMGRCWELDEAGESPEFEDFQLLLDLHEAGETVLIEIED